MLSCYPVLWKHHLPLSPLPLNPLSVFVGVDVLLPSPYVFGSLVYPTTVCVIVCVGVTVWAGSRGVLPLGKGAPVRSMAGEPER